MTRHSFFTVNRWMVAALSATIVVWTTAFAPKAIASSGVTVIESGIPEVSLLPLDSVRVDSRLVALFRQRGDEWAYFRPFAAVIANESGARIKGLTMAWTVTDGSGRSQTAYYSETHYFLDAPSQSAVGARSQTLLLPSGNVSANALTAGSTVTAASSLASLRVPSHGRIEEFRQAARVTVEIDAVMFEDGRVAGGDRSHTVVNLEERQAALPIYIRRLRSAVAAQQDITPELAEMKAFSSVPPGEGEWPDQLNGSLNVSERNLLHYWLSRLAWRGSNDADSLRTLDRLEQIPLLPKFLRD